MNDAPHSSLQPFARLTPNTVLAALEEIGLRCDGRLQALNSFENRVYLVGLEDGDSRVAKFYRPDRWGRNQLLEDLCPRDCRRRDSTGRPAASRHADGPRPARPRPA